MTHIEYDDIGFEWDANNAKSNKGKHKVSFELATQAFFDDNCVTKKDFVKDGEQRWKTLGVVNGVLLLFVGHLLYESMDEDDEKEVTKNRVNELIRIFMREQESRLISD